MRNLTMLVVLCLISCGCDKKLSFIQENNAEEIRKVKCFVNAENLNEISFGLKHSNAEKYDFKFEAVQGFNNPTVPKYSLANRDRNILRILLPPSRFNENGELYLAIITNIEEYEIEFNIKSSLKITFGDDHISLPIKIRSGVTKIKLSLNESGMVVTTIFVPHTNKKASLKL
jgi:hypothetical protein